MNLALNQNYKTHTENPQKMSNRTDIINALNGIVADRNKFDAEEWLNYLYPEAVALQKQTTSKKKVHFLPEIWEIIKSYAVGFDARDLVFKSKIYKSLLGTNNLISLYDDRSDLLFSRVNPQYKKGTRFVLPDSFGGLCVAELLGTYNVSALEKKAERGESEPSYKVKIVGSLDLKAYLPIAREVEYGREVVRRYTLKKEEEDTHYLYAEEILAIDCVFPKGTKGKEEFISVGRRCLVWGEETKVWADEEEEEEED